MVYKFAKNVLKILDRIVRIAYAIVVAALSLTAALLLLLVIVAFAISFIITFPIFARTNLYLDIAYRIYEMECSIINVLKNAMYDGRVKHGWLTEEMLFSRIRDLYEGDERRCERQFKMSLKKLIREDVVLKNETLNDYIEDKPRIIGWVNIYKLNDDSDYKPKRPKKIPKKKEERLSSEVQAA